MDANPASYQVNTGTLTLTEAPGTPVRIGGFVVPFGQATATEDFDAVRVEDLHIGNHAHLVAGWGDAGTTAPFSSVSDSGLVLDLANPALGTDHSGHFLLTGDTVLDLLTLAPQLTIGPASTGEMHFAIKQGRSVQAFAAFADFVTALNGLVDGTNVVSGLYAEGTYDSATGNFAAPLVLVRIGVADMH